MKKRHRRQKIEMANFLSLDTCILVDGATTLKTFIFQKYEKY